MCIAGRPTESVWRLCDISTTIRRGFVAKEHESQKDEPFYIRSAHRCQRATFPFDGESDILDSNKRKLRSLLFSSRSMGSRDRTGCTPSPNRIHS